MPPIIKFNNKFKSLKIIQGDEESIKNDGKNIYLNYLNKKDCSIFFIETKEVPLENSFILKGYGRIKFIPLFNRQDESYWNIFMKHYVPKIFAFIMCVGIVGESLVLSKMLYTNIKNTIYEGLDTVYPWIGYWKFLTIVLYLIGAIISFFVYRRIAKGANFYPSHIPQLKKYFEYGKQEKN